MARLTDLGIGRKLTLRAEAAPGDVRQVVFKKNRQESIEHVWMKAALWALYLPAYPEMKVEVGIGDRYKPDLVQLDPDPVDPLAPPVPVFWGEAGKVSAEKYRQLGRRFPTTHFAVAKWAERLDPHLRIIERALEGARRSAPFEVLSVPPGAVEPLREPVAALSFSDVERVRVG